MSLFDFPFFRKSIPSVGNPAFVDDILAANQLTIDGMTALTGLSNPGFAIISGLKYTAGAPGMYTPGVFWLNGFFYYMQLAFSEGEYLAPNQVDVNSEPFSDLSLQMTYTEYYAGSVSSPTGNSPLFSGNMNQYRIDLTTINTNLLAAMATISSLGSAAYLNVGTTSGTVAAGDDSRFGYTVAQINSLFALQTQVLLTTSGGTPGTFTPVQPNHPATKAYVDANSTKSIASGQFTAGNVGGAGGLNTEFTVPIGLTLANTHYIPLVVVISTSTDGQTDAIWAPMTRNYTTTSFDVYLQKNTSNTTAINIKWILFPTSV